MAQRIVLSFCLLLPCAAAPAQQPPDAGTQISAPAQMPSPETSPANPSTPAQPLTLAEALAMGQQNSPRLRAARSTVERATGAVQTARAYSNPQVQYLGGDIRARDVPNPAVPGISQHFSVSQTIEIPSERSARLGVAKNYQSASRFRESAEELSLTADIKRAFYNALRSKEEINLAQGNLTLVEDLRRRVETEFRVGEKGRLEFTRAEAELARARFAVRSSQLALANSIAVLRAVMGAPADAVFDPTGELEAALPLPPLNETRELLLRTNPQLAEAKSVVSANQSAIEREKAVRVPRPDFYSEYERQPDQTFWRVGVTVPLPIFDKRRGQIAEATAIAREATAIQDQRRIELISSLERAYNQYQLADQQATALESGSMHEAESAVEAAKSAYRFGERGIVEVLDAQRVLQSVRGDLLGARFARQSALVDLEQLGVAIPGGRP